MGTDPLLWPSGAKSHHEVSAWRERVYHEGVLNGTHHPFVLTFSIYGTGMLVLHLLVPTLRRRFERLLLSLIHI